MSKKEEKTKCVKKLFQNSRLSSLFEPVTPSPTPTPLLVRSKPYLRYSQSLVRRRRRSSQHLSDSIAIATE
mgnify:CR=1 FL=1